jgi:hypothetical protein
MNKPVVKASVKTDEISRVNNGAGFSDHAVRALIENRLREKLCISSVLSEFI